MRVLIGLILIITSKRMIKGYKMFCKHKVKIEEFKIIDVEFEHAENFRPSSLFNIESVDEPRKKMENIIRNPMNL